MPAKATTLALCRVCQKAFFALDFNVQRGKAKSCSIACRSAARRKPKPIIEIGPSFKKHGPWQERFWRKVQKTDACWLWLACLDSAGYGRFSIVRERSYAHQLAYSELHGPIPDGLELDHVCHSNDPSCPGGPCVHRRCVNPAHLEAVTHRVNTLRGQGYYAKSARASRL